MLAGDNYRALERKYTIFNLVASLHWVPGDIAECGAYNGGTAFFMALAAERSGRSRSVHLFDSFEGLPEPGAEDAATGMPETSPVRRKQRAATSRAFATLNTILAGFLTLP